MVYCPRIRRLTNFVPTLRVGTQDPAALRLRGIAFDAERRHILFPRRARERAAMRRSPPRTGGVYIAVLGSAMIIALFGLCAMIGQRIENRLVVASTDIRQAQLNANTAVELAILAMK